jgi:hypothetical protein
MLKDNLLQQLSLVANTKKEVSWQDFLPLSQYRNAVEPNIIFIIGDRGTGKTELFRALNQKKGREILKRTLNIRSYAFSSSLWVSSFGQTNSHVKDLTLTLPQWRGFWVGLLVGILLTKEEDKLQCLHDNIPQNIKQILIEDPTNVSRWLSLVMDDLKIIENALDKLNDKLEEGDTWLFMTYDNLDKISSQHDDITLAIRGLLAFWLDRERSRIRPKIFLKTDMLTITNISIFRGCSIYLKWTTHQLYRLLIKRMANSSKDFFRYLTGIDGLIEDNDLDLGRIPTNDERFFELFVEMMVGSYMGSSPKKGYTYNWIPNRLQDGNGRITPQIFLRYFALAASRRIDNRIEECLPGSRLLSPLDLKESVIDISGELIQGLPFLLPLKNKMNEKGIQFLIDKDDFLNILKETDWSGSPFPDLNVGDIFEYLLSIGIVNTIGSYVNMPDIYIHGFCTKRRGGIKRPEKYKFEEEFKMDKVFDAFVNGEKVPVSERCVESPEYLRHYKFWAKIGDEWAAWNGARCCWGINLQQYNYLKDKVPLISSSCRASITCNGKSVNYVESANLHEAWLDAQVFIRKMENHFFDFSDPLSMIGKPVYYDGNLRCFFISSIIGECGEIDIIDNEFTRIRVDVLDNRLKWCFDDYTKEYCISLIGTHITFDGEDCVVTDIYPEDNEAKLIRVKDDYISQNYFRVDIDQLAE